MTADEQAKAALDAVSVGTVVATLAGWLPSVAALLTIVWTCIRIFESVTWQKFKAWMTGLLK